VQMIFYGNVKKDMFLYTEAILIFVRYVRQRKFIGFDSMGESLLYKMMDYIEEQSINRAKNRNNFDEEDDTLVFHVSDLVYCRRKQMLMRENPEMSAKVSVLPSVFNGIIFEIGLRQYMQDYFDTTEYIPRFSYKGKKKIGKYTVVGEADVALFSDTPSGLKVDTIIDIKNRVMSNKWKDYYVLQLLFYKWMFNADNILLWCFSSSASHKEWEISNENSIDDDFVINLIEHPRQPMWDWECKYCKFSKDCPYINGGENGRK